jgi:gliding motility-associated-like protein
MRVLKILEMKLLNIFCFLLILSASTFGQYLENPSFEGSPGIDLIPPGWIPFNQASSPDTEPLDCDNYPAADGTTYITLVARGSGSQGRPNTSEDCQSPLLQSLLPGECYTLSMDLASRDDLGHYRTGEGFIYYSAPVILRVYGSADPGDKGESLLETEPVLNIHWETMTVTLKPRNEIKFLLFEVQLAGPSAENGNLLIDNLEINHLLDSMVVLNDTFTESDLPITLEASESSSYSWLPSSGLSCDDCRTPEVNNSTDITYACRIISASSGCPAIELFTLNFIDDPGPSGEFKIPNVFTPNSDGINDFFEITGLPPYSSLRIYDRSGIEVYRSETYQNDWDGRSLSGNPLPAGTYWYVLVTPGLEKNFKGFVYIKLD